MKAWQLEEIGSISFNEVPNPELKSGHALLRVKACGICSSDIPRVFENGTYHFPTIPGHEFSGVVVGVGDEADKEILGKRFAVFPLIPCKTCDQCMQGNYEMCRQYDYLGSRSDGAFAEYVQVPIWNLIAIPDELPYEVAALVEPTSVAVHAVSRANLERVRSVAVVGSGVIGLMIAQWVRQVLGYDVTVFVRNDSKKSLLDVLQIKTQQLESQSPDSYDLVFEVVGTAESLDASINLANPHGQVVLVGNPNGDMQIKKQTYWKVLRQQLVISGTWNSTFGIANSDWENAIDFLTKNHKSVKSLITDVYPLNQLDNALNFMRSKSKPFIKVMVTND